MRRAHLLGIGGAGVSALARALLSRGYEVSGCDLRESETTRALAAEGASIEVGHSPEHMHARLDLVVYSGAVRAAGQAELAAARAAGIRVLSRAELLAELMQEFESVAIAGSHGKTTVTYMLGHVLQRAGWDPTVLVGDGANSRAGQSRYLVAEADESDGTLVLHRPSHGILTNVDFDHPDHFSGLEEIATLFRNFVAVIPGLAVVGADDERAREFTSAGRLLTYGFHQAADYRCRRDESGSFEALRGEVVLARLKLPFPGRHNVQNATGALAMAVELGVDPEVAAAALADFPGAHRRLEPLGEYRGARLLDDYGHHPAEVTSTLAAVRELRPGRLVIVFQPQRYTRYEALRDDFARSLLGADVVVVAEIYPAGEPNPGLSARDLAAAVPGARFAPDLAEARRLIQQLARPGDVIVFMGAGDIWKVGSELAKSR
ncbi:MAG: UDP-N-acetylmuramate--L-alanine ligase [Candidatus Dormibacter sp.]|uniref:UDP-N-acetylmuramate--L-alanine ligase n=1 Tax=Candidatus Dormibacter sp. TaxID=2973982 RepID=UPI000DAFBAC0|nr:MAG: UDP-N-acetylmuramate--L-alanine ligase [Candidatus Dormibacteraeota bacterium]